MKIKLETATLIDSLRKAEAIAPKKGDASDITYGIILEVDAEQKSLVSKATDGVFFYMESISILEIDGEGREIWRVPSSVFYGSVSKLPSKLGSTVTLEYQAGMVEVKSGRTVIKIATTGHETFPEFEFYDSAEFMDFTNITGKSNKLKWATSNLTNDPKYCVFVCGNKMYSTDGYRAARIELDEDTGVTALYPPLTLSRVIPFGADVKVKKDGNLLVIAPDEFSQLCMATMDHSNFPYGAIDKMMENPCKYISYFEKSEAMRMLDGVAPLAGKNDELAEIVLFIGKGEFAVYFQSETGMFGDRIEARGDATEHARMRFTSTHSIIRSAIDSMSDTITMEYDANVKKLRFNDGTYKAIIALRTAGK